MSNVFTETWEGAGNTVVATPANTSFAHVFTTGITHSNLHVISGQGSEGGRVVATGAYQQAQATFTAIPVMYVSMPLRLASAPDTATAVFVAKTGTGFDGYLVITADRRIQVRDSAAATIAQSPANTVPLNTDGRIEWKVDTASDQQQARWFNSATGTSPDWDSGMVATVAVSSVDTLNVGANWPCTWEAFFGDLTVDNAAWPNFGTPPSGGTIAHRGSATGSATGTGTTVSVVIPAATVVGDQMILEFVGGANTVWTQTNPAGWTRLSIDQTGGLPKLNVWKRIAQAGDAGSTVTVTSNNTSGAYYRNLHVNVYSNAAVGAAASVMASTTSTAHSTPTVTAVSNNAWIHTGCADRNAPGSTNFTVSSGLTKRSELYIPTGSSAVSVATASDSAPGSGVSPSYTYTGTISINAALTWAIVLEPTGTVTPVTVNAPSDVTVEPWRNITLTPSASGTVTTWSWTQLSATPPQPVLHDMTAGATVDSDGTIHIAVPAAIVEVDYTLRVIGHVTGVTPDASDDMVVTVYPATRQFVQPDGTIVPLRIQRVT